MDTSRLTGPPMALRLGGQPLPMVGRVRMYVCGITPYDVTHLGHAATYVWADAAERVLSWHGHTVTVARNVTDVDEVLFAEARRRGEQYSMLATLQRAKFENTMSALRVRTPDHSPTAAQAVGQVIQLAFALLARDAAYLRGGTVYARAAAAAQLAGLVHRRVTVVDAAMADALYESLCEVGANVRDHSGADVGFMVAQHMPSLNELRFAVADAGDGLLATLSARGARTDADAIGLALDGVSRFDDPDRGNGLRTTVNLVAELDGVVYVASGHGSARDSASSRAYDTSPHRFAGSLVEAAIPLSRGRHARSIPD